MKEITSSKEVAENQSTASPTEQISIMFEKHEKKFKRIFVAAYLPIFKRRNY
jgi:hypothetical protein